MDGLTLNRLEKDAAEFDVFDSYVYERTYFEILSFFQDVRILQESHLILFAQIIYGSMPTMVNINLKNTDRLLTILSKARDGVEVNLEEIRAIKEYINNSLVGTSKLLHFLNPTMYAIWDSRIHRYITGKTTSYGIGDVQTYISYLERIRDISSQDGYNKLHQKIAKHFDYEIQPSRVMEIIMFQTDKQMKNLRKL
ncbi:hypothetical protein [Zobellia sp. 1_MG-2023]|uniref:hypothetical protein n=1 Tax=Zobellia sp. 1_MG-2023 TaxID=3062626 RepID=UPI0026E467E0|nr:hypothetical protein [Zobellia sp. 1_MG-2023]MDO6821327.1 hypothetical protein [Zobellia sp. 1_MG-2023]